jgi:hypothetical protein
MDLIPAGDEQFDDIGPHLNQLTHRPSGLLRAIDEAIALDVDFRPVIAVAMATRDAQRVAGGKDSW